MIWRLCLLWTAMRRWVWRLRDDYVAPAVVARLRCLHSDDWSDR